MALERPQRQRQRASRQPEQGKRSRYVLGYRLSGGLGEGAVDTTKHARAYLPKEIPDTEVLTAIHEVHAGRRYLPPAAAVLLAEALPQPALSGREMQVLELMGEGLPNRDIAETLGVEESTVKVYVRGVLSKLGVDQRTEAVVVALKRGLLHLG